MKRKIRIRGNFFSLFAKGYIGFTVALILITGATFYLNQIYFENLARVPDIDSLIEDPALESGAYEEVPVRKLLGTGGAFAVLDQKGNVLYRSSEEIKGSFTTGEIDAIPQYNEDSFVDHLDFTAEDGSLQHLLIKYIYDETGDVTEKIMILDDFYRVKMGGFGDGRKSYTWLEYGYMTGTEPAGYDIVRYDLPAGEDGEKKILLAYSKVQSMEEYQHILKKSNRIYFILIPLYLIAVTGFILWLNHKIKRPLTKLNEAIDSLSAGGDGRVGELKGPWEIQKIGNNFDRMADLLAASEKERQKMDQERQKLIADISHDLKTPITVISGYTKAIRDHKIPPEKVKTYLEMIDARAEELNQLVNSFHEFSKVEHPAFTLHTEILDICEFTRTYLADRYDEIDLAGFNLEAEIPEEKIFCAIDGYQFRRVLDNILYNSLKHNSLGTMLAVQIGKPDKEGKYVSLRIADNGIGIPKEQREKIFEPFVMGDESRGGGGSGLGLAITRRIVQAHGGSVTLCEPDTSGFSTTFEILLPVKKTQESRGKRSGIENRTHFLKKL